MKPLHLISTVLFLVSISLKAQTWEWDTAITKPHWIKFCLDDKKNIYTWHYNENEISCYNAEMQAQWSKTLESVSLKSLVYYKGFIYVTGHYEKKINIDGISMQNVGGQDIFFAKFSATNGQLIFLKNIGSKGHDYSAGITILNKELVLSGTSADSIFIDGNLHPKSDNPDFFIIKFTEDGALTDVRIAQSLSLNNTNPGGSFAREIKTDRNGHLVVLMFNSVDTKYNTDTLPSSKPGIFHLLTLNSNLELLSHFQVNSKYEMEINNMEIDKNNNRIFILQEKYHYSSSGSVVRYSENGTLMNHFIMDGTCWLTDISLSENGDFLFTGYSMTNAAGFQGPKFYSLIAGELDQNFNLHWIKKETAEKYRAATAIMDCGNRGLLISGQFSDSLQLKNQLTSLDHSSFLAILSANPTNIISHQKSLNELNIFPNPSNGTINTNSIPENCRIKIYNMEGKEVLFRRISNNAIEIAAESPGIYLAEMKMNDAVLRKKLIIE